MTRFYHADSTAKGDAAYIRANGMWYRSWQAGYDDILKRGVPQPRNRRTILAELHSPQVSSFLHDSGDAEVPFLVTKQVRQLFDAAQLTGFRYAPVKVVKIATHGLRPRVSRAGEPEDAILKAKGVTGVPAPRLFAVYVTAAVEVVPRYLSGEHPSGMTSPFSVTRKRIPYDLWRPTYRGGPFSPWVFCSERLRDLCVTHALGNVRFQTLDAFMRNWTRQCKPSVWRRTRER